MRYFVIAIILCSGLHAVTVDRLAVSLGSTVITELQIDEDLRVAALLNEQPISRDLESRRAAADRLIQQLLIQHEIELSHYPAPSEDEVTTFYQSIQANLGGVDRLKQMLNKYEVTEQTLRSHLTAQLAALSFIEVRFRPDINITDAEIEAAYHKLVVAQRAATPEKSLPPLDAAGRAKISQTLVEERTDAALESWLAESRKQVNIVYIDTELQ